MTQGQNKKLLYVGGLAEEVDEKMLHAAFIPFGDIIGRFYNISFVFVYVYLSSDITIPLDFETEAHRGFAFVEFEDVADAAAAMDNMDEAELFGRTLKVNIARPIKVTTFELSLIFIVILDERWPLFKTSLG